MDRPDTAMECLERYLISPVDYRTLLELADARGIAEKGARLGLNSDQSISIFAYTLPDYEDGRCIYRAINTALRHPLSLEALMMAPLVQTLTRAVLALPVYRGPLVRRTQLPRDVLDIAQSQGVFSDAGVLSFSRDPNLHLGVDMLFVDARSAYDLRPLSFFPDECEAVFPPGTPFSVIGFIKEGSGAIVLLEED